MSPPPNSCIEAPALNVTVFGGRAFREVIKVNGVLGVGTRSDRISVPVRRDPREPPLSSPCTQPLCGVAGGRWPSTSQEEGSHQEPRGPQLDLGLPASRAMRDKCLLLMPHSLVFSYGNPSK